MAFATKCPNILEIDLYKCSRVGNAPITALLQFGRSLRELRLANCELIEDAAFLDLPPHQVFEHLRILDLTGCERLTDRAVHKITSVAPRVRNLVLAKCRQITDVGVNAITRLGKNLHYVHLGHCSQITDEGVKVLAIACPRIRYIDLGCCTQLTDASVMRLATLPKLRRIGLVKCAAITDESVYALAHVGQNRRIQNPDGPDALLPPVPGSRQEASSLERVHLSYCVDLSLRVRTQIPILFCSRL
jgi:F-box and leucine-rich repeat protein GRR1